MDIIKTFNDRHPNFYWLDKDTFCLYFDGGIDEYRDEYSYLVEYHKDEDRFVFVKLYEYDNMPANFTAEEMNYITARIKEKLKEGG